ncbi:MAG TPA: polysaccharide deacetylase family protein [Chitinophagaceae bacterium]|nr:polysaccharide deacetylase family protein [Chitinophagaceae bacterium]
MPVIICLQGRAQPPVNEQKPPINIYLTFDDGPVKSSWSLIEMLCRDSIPITVFLVGKNVFSKKEGNDILQFYRNSICVEIDNHSFNHANKKYKAFYSHPERVIKDILLNEDTLRLENKIVRLPGRNVWRINGSQRNDLADASIAADSLANRGFRIFGWDIAWQYDSLTQAYQSASQMIGRIKYLTANKIIFTPGHVVILCHDYMLEDESGRSQLQVFIKEIKSSGNWFFKKIKEYPSYCPPDPGDDLH